MLQDLRYAFRSLFRSAGSTAIVVLTLALAMGTSAVFFSVFDTVLQIVPARDRSRTVYLSSTDPQHGRRRASTSEADFADWKAQTTSFEVLGALTFGTFNLSDVETPVRLSAVKATADVFDVLGVAPDLGRTFRPDEDRPGAAHVVLLSNQFWRRQFGGDSRIVGESLRLDGERYAIVGILPAGLDAGLFRQMDVWVPLAIDPGRSLRDERTLGVFGRLKSGVTRGHSSAELASIARTLEQQHPDTNTGIGAVVDPIIEAMGGGRVRVVLAMLMFMAALLVAVACANVANVMLARASARRRELAVRTAIGASRWRIVRQLMVEDLVLSLTAGTVGVLLCAWEVDAVRAIAGRDMTIISDLTVDWSVLLFALAVSLVAPLAFGLLPALRSSAIDIRDSLKETASSVTGGRRGRRLRNALVGCQVALALMLLLQVGVLARGTIALGRTEKGFDANRLLTLRIDLPSTEYGDPRRATAFFDALTTRLEALPGVQSAGVTSRRPIADREVPTRFTIEGQPTVEASAQPWAALATVSAGYRATLRIPLLQGRDLAPGAASEQPTALISRFAAQRYWPAGDPIGRRIRLQNASDNDRWIEIVGIVGDVRNSDVEQDVIPQIYLLHSDEPQRAMAVVVRSQTDPASLAGSVRAEVSQLDRDLPVYAVATMEQVLFEDLASTYILVGMVVALALIALGLAAAGIYGVIAYAVTQRTHEIGVRMALGADASAVCRMVVAQGLTPVIVGSVVGLAGGFTFIRLTSSALREISAGDPTTYAGVMLLLTLVSLLASYLPARRATGIDPVAALRAE